MEYGLALVALLGATYALTAGRLAGLSISSAFAYVVIGTGDASSVDLRALRRAARTVLAPTDAAWASRSLRINGCRCAYGGSSASRAG
jgi:hypothetical protein